MGRCFCTADAMLGSSCWGHTLDTKLSKLLTEFPPFLSAVSMVGDDQEETIRELQYAERPSPEFYRWTRGLFLSVLRGQLDFQAAVAQVRQLPDGSRAEVRARCP
jgi:hypothetical protein